MFKTLYADRPKVQSAPKGASMAKQAFKDEADINHIMSRYRKTGLLVDPSSVNSSRRAFYGEFADSMEFKEAQNRIAQVRNSFEMLPSSIRSLFENDPSVMLDFLADPENASEALEMGLISKAEFEQLKPPAPAAEAPLAPSGEPTGEPDPIPSPTPVEGS